MTVVTQSTPEIMENLECILREAQNAVLVLSASEGHQNCKDDKRTKDPVNELSILMCQLRKAARMADSYLRQSQCNGLNIADVGSQTSLEGKGFGLVQDAYTMMLILNVLSKWESRKSDEIKQALRFILASIGSSFQFLTSACNTLREDSTMMDLLLHWLFEFGESTTNYDIQSFFCSTRLENNDGQSSTMQLRQVQSQQRSMHDIHESHGETTDLLTTLVHLASKLQLAHNTSHNNQTKNKQKRGNKRRRVMCNAPSANIAESKLWQIPLVYSIARLTFDLLRRGHVDFGGVNSTQTPCVTVDDFINKTKSLTHSYERLNNSIYETAGIACFLLDVLATENAVEARRVFADLSVQRVSEYLCRYPNSSLLLLQESSRHVSLYGVTARCVQILFRCTEIDGGSAVVAACSDLFRSCPVNKELYVKELEAQFELDLNQQQQTCVKDLEYGVEDRNHAIIEDNDPESFILSQTFAEFIRQPSYPLFVHLDLLLIEDTNLSIRQAVCLASQMEQSPCFTEYEIRIAYDKLFCYFRDQNYLFDESRPVELSLQVLFIPHAGVIAMDVFSTCLQDLAGDIMGRDETIVSQAEKGYIWIACHRLLLHLLIFRYSHDEGTRIYAEKYGTSVAIELLNDSLIQMPESVQTISPFTNAPVLDIYACLMRDQSIDIHNDVGNRRSQQPPSRWSVDREDEPPKDSNAIVLFDNYNQMIPTSNYVYVSSDNVGKFVNDELSNENPVNQEPTTDLTTQDLEGEDEFYDAFDALESDDVDERLDTTVDDIPIVAVATRETLGLEGEYEENLQLGKEVETNLVTNFNEEFDARESGQCSEEEEDLYKELVGKGFEEELETLDDSEEVESDQGKEDSETRSEVDEDNEDVIEVVDTGSEYDSYDDDYPDSSEHASNMNEVESDSQTKETSVVSSTQYGDVKAESSSNVKQDTSYFEDGYDAEDSQGHATEEEEDRARDISAELGGTDSQDMQIFSYADEGREVKIESASLELDPGYEAEESQEEASRHERRTGKRVEAGYEAEESQWQTEEDEGDASEAVHSDDDDYRKRVAFLCPLENGSDGTEPGERRGSCPVDQQSYTCSDMSAADERTAAEQEEDLEAESSELEDTAADPEGKDRDTQNKLLDARDIPQAPPKVNDRSEQNIDVRNSLNPPQALSLQYWAVAVQREDDTRRAASENSAHVHEVSHRPRLDSETSGSQAPSLNVSGALSDVANIRTSSRSGSLESTGEVAEISGLVDRVPDCPAMDLDNQNIRTLADVSFNIARSDLHSRRKQANENITSAAVADSLRDNSQTASKHPSVVNETMMYAEDHDKRIETINEIKDHFDTPVCLLENPGNEDSVTDTINQEKTVSVPDDSMYPLELTQKTLEADKSIIPLPEILESEKSEKVNDLAVETAPFLKKLLDDKFNEQTSLNLNEVEHVQLNAASLIQSNLVAGREMLISDKLFEGTLEVSPELVASKQTNEVELSGLDSNVYIQSKGKDLDEVAVAADATLISVKQKEISAFEELDTSDAGESLLQSTHHLPKESGPLPNIVVAIHCISGEQVDIIGDENTRPDVHRSEYKDDTEELGQIDPLNDIEKPTEANSMPKSRIPDVCEYLHQDTQNMAMEFEVTGNAESLVAITEKDRSPLDTQYSHFNGTADEAFAVESTEVLEHQTGLVNLKDSSSHNTGDSVLKFTQQLPMGLDANGLLSGGEDFDKSDSPVNEYSEVTRANKTEYTVAPSERIELQSDKELEAQENAVAEVAINIMDSTMASSKGDTTDMSPPNAMEGIPEIAKPDETIVTPLQFNNDGLSVLHHSDASMKKESAVVVNSSSKCPQGAELSSNAGLLVEEQTAASNGKDQNSFPSNDSFSKVDIQVLPPPEAERVDESERTLPSPTDKLASSEKENPYMSSIVSTRDSDMGDMQSRISQDKLNGDFTSKSGYAASKRSKLWAGSPASQEAIGELRSAAGTSEVYEDFDIHGATESAIEADINVRSAIVRKNTRQNSNAVKSIKDASANGSSSQSDTSAFAVGDKSRRQTRQGQARSSSGSERNTRSGRSKSAAAELEEFPLVPILEESNSLDPHLANSLPGKEIPNKKPPLSGRYVNESGKRATKRKMSSGNGSTSSLKDLVESKTLRSSKTAEEENPLTTNDSQIATRSTRAKRQDLVSIPTYVGETTENLLQATSDDETLEMGVGQKSTIKMNASTGKSRRRNGKPMENDETTALIGAKQLLASDDASHQSSRRTTRSSSKIAQDVLSENASKPSSTPAKTRRRGQKEVLPSDDESTIASASSHLLQDDNSKSSSKQSVALKSLKSNQSVQTRRSSRARKPAARLSP